MTQTPEQKARQTIDRLLIAAGWTIQDHKTPNLHASAGVAICEPSLQTGEADYLLFVDGRAIGVIEAKREGHTLSGAIPQAHTYSRGIPPYMKTWLPDRTLPFRYISTGVETIFVNDLDPKPRSRPLFAFHQPATLRTWVQEQPTLRARFQTLPPLATAALWKPQITAIQNLEASLAQDKPRALIQMATGSGKTFTAINFIYRLIKSANARRVLFLVDRTNLGDQTLKEFQNFTTPDDGRKFTELYNVQQLKSSHIDADSRVVITTIQRLYSILSGNEQIDPDIDLKSLFQAEEEGVAQQPVTVSYNGKVPIETFDIIVTDECHRSIYNVWRDVLLYFDAHLIGLTATPTAQTIGFFNENRVMAYTHRDAVADGINVQGDVFRIRTRITEQGSTVPTGEWVTKLERQTRRRQPELLGQDFAYAAPQLGADVITPSQIRLVINTFRNALFRDLFPERTAAAGPPVVPKTLIFARDDNHLVRFYVDELLGKDTTSATFRAEELYTIQPRLQGYIDKWWQVQETEWKRQGCNPLLEQKSLRLLFNALAAAMGPLTQNDLEALTPDLADGVLVRSLTNLVSRWLIGDGKTHGYTFSHSRLGYYFWEQMGRTEQAAWDASFTAWGASTVDALNNGALSAQATPRYLVQHYATHLTRSSALPVHFYALISDGWRRAWEEIDVSHGGFLNDVDCAWSQARQAYDPTKFGRTEALIQQIKGALCHGSVTALGHKLTPELLAQAVACNIHTPIQALAIVKLRSKEQRAPMLIALAPYLSQPLLDEALAMARAITDAASQASVLAKLSAHLPTEQQEEVLIEALAVTRTIKDTASCAKALGELTAFLPTPQKEQVLTEALEMARTVTDASALVVTLGTLAVHLSPPQQRKLFEEILPTARLIEDPHFRVIALNTLAVYLPEPLLGDALVTASRLRDMDEPSYARDLGSLGKYLPQRLLKQAIAAARTITDAASRAIALGILAVYLPTVQQEQVLKEAITLASTIAEAPACAKALTALAPHLSAPFLKQALAAVSATTHLSPRTSILRKLAPHLPAPLLEEALVIASTITEAPFRMQALSAVAKHLPAAQQKKAIEEALAASREIGDTSSRAVILSKLAPYLPEPLYAQILAMVKAIPSPYLRMSTLHGLALALPEPHQQEMFAKTLAAARDIKALRFHASELSMLVAHLPRAQQKEVHAEALAIARMIAEPEHRAAALAAVTVHLPPIQRGKVFEEALAATRRITSMSSLISTLRTLAPDLPTAFLKEAFTIAKAIQYEFFRVQALHALVPHLPDPLLEAALAQIKQIAARASHSSAFTSTRAQSELLAETQWAIKAVTDTSNRRKALRMVAPDPPEPLLKQALETAQKITDLPLRATTLGELTVHLSAAQQDDVITKALDTARMITNLSSRASTLGALMVYLSTSQQREVIQEALAMMNIGTDPDFNKSVLQTFGPHLTAWTANAPVAAHAAVASTLQTLSRYPRPCGLDMLMPSILALAGDEAPQVAEGIFHAIQDVYTWWP